MEREIVVAWLLPGGDSLVLAIYFLLTMLRFISIASLALSALAPMAAEAASSCGTASFYGLNDGFAGQRTANGERFTPSKLTTAHPSLPFGTKLRVTNRINGRSVVVRVNDRGPYYGSRIIDLSHGAFAQIASTSQGLASVCISKV
jgi:rare lipoprotein A